MKWNYIIVGAGISGIALAQRLRGEGYSVLILEKSKGVGGRMATRRWKDQLFDHGAQQIRIHPLTKPLYDQWSQENLLSNWKAGYVICPLGMSKLAKSAATNLKLQLEKKAILIHKTENHYKIECEEGSHFLSENLVLSSPLPQSLKLLNDSNIQYNPTLEEIHYAKALVFLVSHNENFSSQLPDYQEWPTGPVFSVTNQSKKFNKLGFAYTFTMSADWSENHFDMQDEAVLFHFKQALEQLKFSLPEGSELQIKKWRFSHPTSTWTNKFYHVENEKIVLIGDAFGGPSVNGAILSALEFKS
ncbi:MAG: NAD(P)/FAD-dependent oxidoreductase [Bdellovibrionales bacterium]